MQILIALGTGLLFGIGLILSGMTDPAKVIGFLDFAGNWDPSLAFVMGGAVVVATIGFRFARRRDTALLGVPMRLPSGSTIDRRLIMGGVTFGVGWGLGGFCPGPALASLLSGGMKPIIFVVAMLVGMALFELVEMLPRARMKRAA